ncbi:MAG: hypothetical protein M1817_006446 [Caeruleum heppii]|nr:MAG: hypothetical protein M1817_006446 [Caeruleum heppii]
MFARCPNPIWRLDDFTGCIRRDYLQILLPLITVVVSILYLCYQVYHQRVSTGHALGYKVLPASEEDTHPIERRHSQPNGHFDDALVGGDDDSDDEDQHLSLQQTKSRANESVQEVDRPRGEVTLVVIEELALLAELGVHVAAYLTHAWGPSASVSAAAALITWAYIFVLASARLLFSKSSKLSFPKLWNHTAALYGTQWLFTVLLFRSAIIHPRSKLAQGLRIADFALVTLLGSIAVTSRKGNKAVIVEYEDGLEPSREPLASLFSIATFSWVDPIVWKGYKKTFELSDVWNLAPRDKAAAILQEYRQVRKTSVLTWHLLKYFRRLFFIQALWACFSSLFTFAPTLLLKVILQYVENPAGTPVNAAWFYVILLFVTGCIQALADGQALWTGRKICLKLRAVIIGEIYAKALRRKATTGSDTVLGAKKDKKDKEKPGLWKRLVSAVAGSQDEEETEQDPKKEESSDSQVNVGTIINLMAVDSFKVSEISAYLHFLWAGVPVQIIIAVTLLYQILGYSSIAGIGMMILLLPINIVIAKQFSKMQKKIMAATDARIHTTNEVLQNIRIIKFFAWEQRFGHIVNEKRSVELKALRNRYILWSVAAMVWYGAPLLITFLSFLIYTVVEKKDLIPSTAFTALSLFSILRIPLDQLADMLAHVQESRVSVDRVEEFLNEEETEKYEQLTMKNKDDDGEVIIGLDHVTCTWSGRHADGSTTSSAFRLIGADVRFRVGQLNIVAGPTGAGKTSLLMALLGEMTLLEGTVHLPGGCSREDLRPDPETGLIESVAYCAQQAWLVNDTIKQNILFASPLDEGRYRQVIEACSLERDLEILDAGDQTQVGEKGITLSGGQKQRVSLARALYSNSRHVLLDDCLSAVDSHTAKWIFDHCIMGPLMHHRTCILVTHNVSLSVPHAQHVVVLDNGKITAKGSPESVIASGALGEDLQQSRPGSRGESRMPSRVQSSVQVAEGQATSNGHANGSLNGKAPKSTKPADQKEAGPPVESKAEGGVKWQIIRYYLAAMGSWWYWTLAFAIFAAQQIGSVATNVWIREWANSYHTKRVTLLAHSQNSTSAPYYPSHVTSFSGHCIKSGSCLWGMPNMFRILTQAASPSISATASSSSNEVDVAYYLGIYALLAVIYMVISLLREFILFAGSLTASWRIHQRLLESVTRAKFRFFDSTPLGQLMNRFSKDLQAVDQEVAPVAIGMIHCLASVVTIVVLISVITPRFLIAAVFISALYFFIGRFYISSSRDLKRLESVQRSPLYQQFGETLSGMTTIRAYGDERRFVRDNLHRVNTHSRPFIYMWATNRWLGLRVDVAGALVAFFAGVFVITNVGKIDAGAAGLSLTYAVQFTENVLWLVRLYAANEQNMNSVERVKEYLDVDQEAPAVIPDARPPANWPSKGSVEFIGYTTSYRSDLDPVLKGVTFSIRPYEKVGIVGRTGAGKSSLALALFRGLEAEEGKILVDDVDIGLIGLQDLRESVTIVPQDPTLFTGTIRSNLDPFGLFTDEEIFTALRRVQLIGADASSTPVLSRPATPGSEASPTNKNIFLNLKSAVTESGNNLSQGQKQLLCLARAMLKEPKVILMDEATASIDYSTDAKIQATIRELNSTTITIAHRLQTIVDYDKVLVLDKGEVKEFDHPWTLLQARESIFRGMCEMSGDLESLEEGAKKAWKSKQLVDTDE